MACSSALASLNSFSICLKKRGILDYPPLLDYPLSRYCFVKLFSAVPIPLESQKYLSVPLVCRRYLPQAALRRFLDLQSNGIKAKK